MRFYSLTKILIATCIISAGAANGGEPPASPVVFEFVHPSHGEHFFAATSDPSVIAAARAQLALPLDQRMLHMHGDIEAGDGGVNAPWSWHFVDGSWRLAEISAEVCDGWPSYIEENLDEWLKSPGYFCPWSSRVLAERD